MQLDIVTERSKEAYGRRHYELIDGLVTLLPPDSDVLYVSTVHHQGTPIYRLPIQAATLQEAIECIPPDFRERTDHCANIALRELLTGLRSEQRSQTRRHLSQEALAELDAYNAASPLKQHIEYDIGERSTIFELRVA
jgi:hypothetical protein